MGVITENVKIDGRATRVTKSYGVKKIMMELRKIGARIRRRKAEKRLYKIWYLNVLKHLHYRTRIILCHKWLDPLLHIDKHFLRTYLWTLSVIKWFLYKEYCCLLLKQQGANHESFELISFRLTSWTQLRGMTAGAGRTHFISTLQHITVKEVTATRIHFSWSQTA
jgi:hypothetical protein